MRLSARDRPANPIGATTCRRRVNWEHLNVFHLAPKVMAHEMVPRRQAWRVAPARSFALRPGGRRVRKITFRSAA